MVGPGERDYTIDEFFCAPRSQIEVVTHIFSRLNCLELIDKVTIRISGQPYKSYGNARWNRVEQKGLVKLRRSAWERLSWRGRNTLLGHELVHIATDYLNKESCMHDTRWEDNMVKVGLKPKAKYAWPYI